MTAAQLIPGYEIFRDGTIVALATGRVLKHEPNADGYASVRLNINGRRVRKSVHALVARQHIGPRPSERHEVRHLDGNRMNPDVANLAWGTRKENADDRERHGRTSRGESHAAALRARAPYERPKGIPPWNKGKTTSAEQKQKLREAMVGRPWSPARRAAAIAAAQGAAS